VVEQYPVPVSPEPVDDTERLAAVARLHDLVGNGSLTLERFSTSLEQVLAANDQADLEMAMAAVPSPVRLTPASRRLSRPLKVDVGIGKLRLGAGWQLAPETEIAASTGKVWLDLAAASWDAREIDLRLRVATGKIQVTVPKGVAVQMVSASGRVTLYDLVPPVPGAPVLRVVASTSNGGGRIRFTHEPPEPVKSHWWQRRKATPAAG
jgi:Domain of unknown function (DUF1707)